MLRRIFLLLCIAFVVVCYGYPFFILPFGEYKGTTSFLGVEAETTYNFKFNGRVTVSYSYSGSTTSNEGYYKLNGKEVIISSNETFGDSDDAKLTLDSMYQISLNQVGGSATNMIGMIISISVGVLAIIAIVAPSKKR